MKRRIRDIDPGIPSGVKKWAELQYEILRQLRNDLNLHKLSKHWVLLDNVRIDMYDAEDASMIRIKGGCDDRKGFLLTRFAGDYEAHYNDTANAVVEAIDPIDGTPRPDPDPATTKRTKGYVLPQQLRGSRIVNSNSGKYSGLMRKAVACYHLGGKEAPFGYRHTKTHGITKFKWGPSEAEKSKYYITEISSQGVYVAPIKIDGTGDLGCCGTSFGVTQYQQTPGAMVDLDWAYNSDPETHKGVKLLIDSAGMAGPYTDPPFQIQQGWAFPVHGREAQQTTFHYAGDDFLDTFHTEWSRWKITFTADDDGVPSAVLTQEETDKDATFLEFSTAWSPHATDAQKWKQDFTIATDESATIANFPSQDAPIHVYYDGDTEVITRWHLDVQNFSQGQIIQGGPAVQYFDANGAPTTAGFACTAEYNSQVIFAPRLINRTLFGFYSTRIDGRVATGAINPGAAPDNYFTVDGAVGVAGTDTQKTGGTGEFKEVSWEIQWGGSAVGITQYSYIKRGTSIGHSSIAVYIEDRESLLHVYDFQEDVEEQLNSLVGLIGLQGAEWTSILSYSEAPDSYPPAFPVSGWPTLADLNLDSLPFKWCISISPLGVTRNPELNGGLPYTPINPTGIPSGIGFVSAEYRTGTGFLGSGPASATVNIPQGTFPLWIPPTNELMQFITTTDPNPATSNIFTLHGNVYYKGKGGGPPPPSPSKDAAVSDQFDNVAYLLEPGTVVAENGFSGVDPGDEVLAFVGKI